ncbi:MAG: GNAT family N-acetyltransferase [Pseudomonadota bacterium]
MQSHVVPVDWHQRQPILTDIRRRVFIEEQSVEPDEEWDGADPDAAHFLVINEAGQPQACARLLDDGQIGRMAVLPEFRGNGLATLLITAIIEHATQRGMDRLFLHAQSYIQGMYAKAGFTLCGPEFDEVGIPHVPMEMKLPIAYDGSTTRSVATGGSSKPANAAPRRIQPPTQTDITCLADAASSLTSLLENSSRTIYLLSPMLDQELFEQDAVIDAFSRFLRSAPRAEMRILIMSSKLIVSRGHRLIDLAQRMDDKVKVKLYNEPFNESTSAFACGDRQHYWLLPSHEQYQGLAQSNNPVVTQQMGDTFLTAWQRSKPDPEMRRLRL